MFLKQLYKYEEVNSNTIKNSNDCDIYTLKFSSGNTDYIDIVIPYTDYIEDGKQERVFEILGFKDNTKQYSSLYNFYVSTHVDKIFVVKNDMYFIKHLETNTIQVYKYHIDNIEKITNHKTETTKLDLETDPNVVKMIVNTDKSINKTIFKEDIYGNGVYFPKTCICFFGRNSYIRIPYGSDTIEVIEYDTRMKDVETFSKDHTPRYRHDAYIFKGALYVTLNNCILFSTNGFETFHMCDIIFDKHVDHNFDKNTLYTRDHIENNYYKKYVYKDSILYNFQDDYLIFSCTIDTGENHSYKHSYRYFYSRDGIRFEEFEYIVYEQESYAYKVSIYRYPLLINMEKQKMFYYIVYQTIHGHYMYFAKYEGDIKGMVFKEVWKKDMFELLDDKDNKSFCKQNFTIGRIFDFIVMPRIRNTNKYSLIVNNSKIIPYSFYKFLYTELVKEPQMILQRYTDFDFLDDNDFVKSNHYEYSMIKESNEKNLPLIQNHYDNLHEDHVNLKFRYAYSLIYTLGIIHKLSHKIVTNTSIPKEDRIVEYHVSEVSSTQTRKNNKFNVPSYSIRVDNFALKVSKNKQNLTKDYKLVTSNDCENYLNKTVYAVGPIDKIRSDNTVYINNRYYVNFSNLYVNIINNVRKTYIVEYDQNFKMIDFVNNDKLGINAFDNQDQSFVNNEYNGLTDKLYLKTNYNNSLFSLKFPRKYPVEDKYSKCDENSWVKPYNQVLVEMDPMV